MSRRSVQRRATSELLHMEQSTRIVEHLDRYQPAGIEANAIARPLLDQ